MRKCTSAQAHKCASARKRESARAHTVTHMTVSLSFTHTQTPPTFAPNRRNVAPCDFARRNSLAIVYRLIRRSRAPLETRPVHPLNKRPIQPPHRPLSRRSASQQPQQQQQRQPQHPLQSQQQMCGCGCVCARAHHSRTSSPPPRCRRRLTCATAATALFGQSK